MHVYPCSSPGEKVMSASRPLIKSVYMNEQTILLKIEFKGDEKSNLLDKG